MSYQSIEECVASKQIRGEMKALHLVENLHGEVGLLGLDIGADGGVKKGFGGFGNEARRVEEEAVELVVAVGGDEGDEEGLGVGEFLVGEEGREEREEGMGRGSEGRRAGLDEFEEGEEGRRA